VCGKKYAYNSSCGDLGLNCPYCGVTCGKVVGTVIEWFSDIFVDIFG
jgi:hypothetical protein